MNLLLVRSGDWDDPIYTPVSVPASFDAAKAEHQYQAEERTDDYVDYLVAVWRAERLEHVRIDAPEPYRPPAEPESFASLMDSARKRILEQEEPMYSNLVLPWFGVLKP